MKKPDLGRLARGFFAGIAIGAAILCAILSYPELRAFLKGPMARDGMGMFMAFWMAAVLLFAAAVFLQTLIHETGHLVSGLATGYRFSSFRIGSFMLYRGDEGLRFGRFTVAGTGGQCLLEPSDTTDPENMPYEAYLLGGVAANLATAAAAFAASIYAESVFWIYLCVAIMLAGVAAALLNGIPMRIGGVPNDGCTVRMMGRSAEMRRMMWVQLKVNALYSRGEMLRDMPDEWFALPDDAGFPEGDFVEVTLSASNSEGGRYLPNMFIRYQDGQPFVYVADENGLLQQRFLTIGNDLWGELTEVKAGLDDNEQIAFPYGSDVFEGAQTTPGSYEDLMTY